jgi:predicted RNA binding protein with dsRBD fold (UPF0201 family)
MDEITIRVETQIYPTEDKNRVEKAVTNIFDIASIETKESYRSKILLAKSSELEALAKFRNLLSVDRIRDAARKALYGGLKENSISFYLNKQVAFSGHISFSEAIAESPLGPIRVSIEYENPRSVIEWMVAHRK